MRNITALFLVLTLCSALLAGCGNSGSETTAAPEPEETEEIGQELEAWEEPSEKPYVTLNDGDPYQQPVAGYGMEFTLPESPNLDAEGEFIGWLGMNGLYQPGDSVTAEEFMEFTALRITPEVSTLVAIDPVRGGYSYSTSEEEEMEFFYSMESNVDENCEDYFDHWEDEAGNSYEDGALIPVKRGEVCILHAIYSTDHSNAWRVEVDYNTGIDDFSCQYFRYVKKGHSIQLWLQIEPADCSFDGWYDAPEGGNRIGDEDHPIIPTSDLSLYAHWIKN